MPSGSSTFWASALHGMGYHSIPTRRASLISATTDQMGLTIRRRMVPRSPSSASPTSGASRGWARTWPDQQAHLIAMMRGHYAYYGITGNFRRLRWYADQVERIWQKWLSRRDRGSRLLWSRFTALLKRHPLPAARIVHRYTFASKTLP